LQQLFLVAKAGLSTLGNPVSCIIKVEFQLGIWEKCNYIGRPIMAEIQHAQRRFPRAKANWMVWDDFFPTCLQKSFNLEECWESWPIAFSLIFPGYTNKFSQ